MIKKTKPKPRGKELSESHRAAISKAMTKPVTELARSAPRDALMALREGLRASITADDLAAAIGTSRTLFYREFVPKLGGSIEAVKELLIPASGSAHAPTSAGPWWLTPASESEGGTRTPLAAAAAGDAEEYECRVAAALYWHQWASQRAPWGPFGEGGHSVHYMNPIGTILGVLLGGQSGPSVPTNDQLTSAPKALIDLAVFVAEEVLRSPRQQGQALVEEARHKAAFRWLVKLTELGFVSAAKALVVGATVTPSLETSHAMITGARALVSREGERRLQARLGQKTKHSALSDEVYAILQIVDLGMDAQKPVASETTETTVASDAAGET